MNYINLKKIFIELSIGLIVGTIFHTLLYAQIPTDKTEVTNEFITRNLDQEDYKTINERYKQKWSIIKNGLTYETHEYLGPRGIGYIQKATQIKIEDRMVNTKIVTVIPGETTTEIIDGKEVEVTAPDTEVISYKDVLTSVPVKYLLEKHVGPETDRNIATEWTEIKND